MRRQLSDDQAGLEPAAISDARVFGLSNQAQLSAAISLKRIADMMEADRTRLPSLFDHWPDAPLPEGYGHG